MGQILTANGSYKLAIEKCHEDENLKKSQIYRKACSNYAVTLEKLGRSDEAIDQFEKLKHTFKNDLPIYNNLGISQKHSGNL